MVGAALRCLQVAVAQRNRKQQGGIGKRGPISRVTGVSVTTFLPAQTITGRVRRLVTSEVARVQVRDALC